MRLSSRLFLISADDTLHALAGAAFVRMLRQEGFSRLPDFAGQRVRSASVIVELAADKTPFRTVRLDFSMLDIGADGRLDVARLNSQQIARIGDLLAVGQAPPAVETSVVDAASRFIARGGLWLPDDNLLRRIEAAALGHLKCLRVRVIR